MDDTAVRCGYSRCRAPLAAPGPQGGRPRAFCRDTRWAGGRTCAQMARAERDALDALGLDSSRSAFALDADRLREHVDAVRGPVEALTAALAAVTGRLAEVEAHAVAAVEAANRQAAEAEARRVAAQEARERAERRMKSAVDETAGAVRERAEAVERAGAAARQALEATEALGAARAAAEQALKTVWLQLPMRFARMRAQQGIQAQQQLAQHLCEGQVEPVQPQAPGLQGCGQFARCFNHASMHPLPPVNWR